MYLLSISKMNHLAALKNVTCPAWFSIIADEATEILNTQQLSVHWVKYDYDEHKDSITFF